MSTSVRGLPAPKKISSWVRPGVCDVRASALRPASALIRLDLPTFERPAKAISMPRIGGSRSTVAAAAANCQSPANSLRPAWSSDLEKSAAGIRRTRPQELHLALCRLLLPGLQLVGLHVLIGRRLG